LAGLKKCVPITSCGRVGELGDAVEIQRGRVAGEDGAGLHAMASSVAEHRSLTPFLEHRLDDDVGVAMSS
jgi:hypothetical protein